MKLIVGINLGYIGRTAGCRVFTGNEGPAGSDTYTGIRGVRLQVVLFFSQEKGV